MARALVVAAVVVAAVIGAVALRPSHSRDPRPAARVRTAPGARARRPARLALEVRAAGRLPAPVQDPATALLGDGALLSGGLNAADVSVADVVRARAGGAGAGGRRPPALHDAAAGARGGSVYVLGGANVSPSDAIVRVAPGAPRVVGRLPAAASDVAAAAVGGTVYVFGGYTTQRPLDTVVAWRPGGRARVVARLPSPVRYAAVASARGAVIVAGGTVGTSASRSILRFDPRAGSVRRIGSLPHPLTHAAATSLAGRVIVAGGRGATLGSQVSALLAVDPASGRVASAGRLPRALSDMGAAGALLVGGRDRHGRTGAAVWRLEARSAGAPAAPARFRIPPLLDPHDVYAADHPGAVAAVARADPPRIYVPNSQSNTVDVIDPRSYRVIEHFATGALPQHVTPSYDLKTLWVDNDEGNSLTPIDPRTGRPGKPVPVADPYNLYFTADGHYAIVVAERLHRLDFRDAHTMRLHRSVPVPCSGVDHMDFDASGRHALVSCEFSGTMLWLDVARERVVRTLRLRAGAMPQDVKLSPDGRVFYVADMMSNGVWLIDGSGRRRLGFIHTGAGAHGLYASRDSRVLYVSNRGEGSISLISFAHRRVIRRWRLPGGGSPDMGGVSADGRVLWLSGRYNAEVYAIDTRSGRLIRRIPVGQGPHGLAVFPQPGRYSLGHTGVFR